MKKFKAKIKNYVREIEKNRSSDHETSLGSSVGAFLAILPTPGFSVLLGVLVVLIYKKINKFSLFLFLAIFNPIVVVPFYLLSYKLGNIIYGVEPVIFFNVIILDQVYNFSRRFLVGNLIVAFVTSFSIYIVMRFILFKFKKNDI